MGGKVGVGLGGELPELLQGTDARRSCMQALAVRQRLPERERCEAETMIRQATATGIEGLNSRKIGWHRKVQQRSRTRRTDNRSTGQSYRQRRPTCQRFRRAARQMTCLVDVDQVACRSIPCRAMRPVVTLPAFRGNPSSQPSGNTTPPLGRMIRVPSPYNEPRRNR